MFTLLETLKKEEKEECVAGRGEAHIIISHRK
jgi:hypothetical protein